ncbi:MAG: RNHCP domain-containing protein [Alphaproteobacteria bacterium]|nr:RNHCP domain-containing protein [Alphaproteobacteria bacterium]
MSRQSENTGFICQNCGKEVLPLTDGSYRNHCPFCLYSLHVDITPGDRQCECGGLMKPIKIVKNKKGFQILHHCQKCGFERYNKINEDMRQPDSIEVITKLMKEQPLP